MSHVLFAAPPRLRFHLHERLLRELRRRGHDATWLVAEPREAAFLEAQQAPLALVRPEPVAGLPADTAGWATIDLAQRGVRATSRGYRRALAQGERRLVGLWPSVQRQFDALSPALVLCHQRRSGFAALVQFAARVRGIPVLWTGEGLLPHTQQIDAGGIDGDASCIGMAAGALRSASRDPKLLAACLAHALGGGRPVGLPSAPLRGTSWLGAKLLAIAAQRAVAATDPALALRTMVRSLPERPFVAVLLQDELDPRRCLDAEPVGTVAFVRAARAAVRRLDPELAVVVVAPARCSRLLRTRLAAVSGGPVLPAVVAGPTAAAALAVLTVNHPAAAIGMLAGTPVVHCGRALYALPTVTTAASVPTLGSALVRAVASDAPTLRERWLTQLFGQRHLWCSASEPDHNGMLGLVAAIERAMGGVALVGRARPAHRIGPPWPLDRSS